MLACRACPAVLDRTRVPSVEAEEFWHRCRQIEDIEPGVRWRTRRLGDSPEVCALLVELVTTGRKTGTFSLLAEFEETGQAVPEQGDYLVITDFDGRPACAVCLDAVETLPFERVDAAWVQVEGPALRELDPWRRVHRDYWTKLLAGWGRDFGPDIRVVCQRFGSPIVP